VETFLERTAAVPGRELERRHDLADLVISTDFRQVGEARTWTRDYLAAISVQVPHAVVADAVLVISELVTNAIKHGRGPIRLRLCHGTDRLLVEVEDGSAKSITLRGPRIDGGRGLELIDRICLAWGQSQPLRPDPTNPFGPRGKTVWAVMALLERR
jgi:anti-sigma regulatory factor (Ser/Thr protein kinase)